MNVKVSDNGVGIPQDIQKNLFQEYRTYDHCKGSNKYGVGLGLSICKRMISYLGPNQNIQINSQENKGTTIEFQVNISDENDSNSSFSTESIARENFNNNVEYESNIVKNQILFSNISFQPSKHFISKTSQLESQCNLPTMQHILNQETESVKIKIMIVDDTPFNIQALKEVISQVKMKKKTKVLVAYNGQMAVNLVKDAIYNQDKSFDLIFMDINMPIMDGIESTRLIRQILTTSNQYSTQQTKIILSTAFTNQSEEKECYDAGCDLYLQKPISLIQISQIMKQVG